MSKALPILIVLAMLPLIHPAGIAACAPAIHNQPRYMTTGPDGAQYHRWHAPLDTGTGCAFGHEHGSNPAPVADIPFGYVAARAGIAEGHEGFKVFSFNDRAGHDWVIAVHLGTASLARACVRFHEVQIRVVDSATRALLADVRFLGDFGKAIDSTTAEVLTPSACPNQGNVGASLGLRQITTAGHPLYEPWRLDASGNILGFVSANLVLNTTDAVVICDAVVCDTSVVTGRKGEIRHFTYQPGLGFSSPPHTGTFWTDPYGRELRVAADPDAVQQYINPGVASAPVQARALVSGDNCYGFDPWAQVYHCGSVTPASVLYDIGGTLKAPN